jgi:hypothetical protein
MNEFVGKKIGEVIAFCEVGIDTLHKGQALAELLGSDATAAKLEALQSHKTALLAAAGPQIDTATAKAAATGEKLKGMREAYIGDEWDNAVEIMEWQGFFEGAAVVHCALVAGAAEELDLSDLQQVANEAKRYHQDELAAYGEQLRSTGAKRAQG